MNSDEQAISSLVASWHRATAAGDVDAVLALMADDVIFLVAGQPPMRGRGTFEHGLRKLLGEHRIHSSGEIQEIVVSGDLAYCWSMLNVSITPLAGGEENSRRGNALSILRKQANGSWLVVRDANLLSAAE